MASSEFGEGQRTAFQRYGRTVLILAFCLILAATVRVAFNYGPATEGTYRFAGNDDYYHHRVVQYVQEEGSHLIDDPLLNYPVGAKNPRPPVYDWSVAIMGQVISWVTPMDQVEAGQYALQWGSALWGILLVIPTWLVGRSLINNATGLWAAFLVAASPANIQRSGYGLGDHDAFILFFFVLGTYFLIEGAKATGTRRTIGSWKDSRSVADGFAEYVASSSTGLAYMFLAGVSFATIALMWEGFPYALAVYAIYYFIQVLSNHMRGKDSLGDLLNMLVLMGTVILMALPFYWVHGNINATISTAVYILAGLLVLSLALVVTRDLPWIIVVPTMAGLGIIGVLVVTLVLPDIGKLLLTANGYFVQSNLYTTIAEAQRTDLGVFVFSVGFMTFFLGIFGFFKSLRRAMSKWEREHVFMLSWALVAIYMAFAASRFVYNATPVFAVLAGWVLWRMSLWMKIRETKRTWESLKNESVSRAIRTTMRSRLALGSIFLALTLVVPNVWFSVDAGIPGEARANFVENHPGARDLLENRTGAFGQGFLGKDWETVYGWLCQQDLTDFDGNPLANHQRPGHIAWWDYGFWEVDLGCHPTVADNFQNGYQLSGRFLAAQGEREGLEWLVIRILEGNVRGNGGALTPGVAAQLESVRPGLAADLQPLLTPRGYDRAQVILRNATTSTAHVVELYESLQSLTGHSIQYFLTDLRMLPYDDPRRPGIEAGSIFYAPVFLAEKNPDDFIQTAYVAQGQEYYVKAYEVKDGKVVQVRPPKIVDTTGREYFYSGGHLYRATLDGQRIDYSFNRGEGIPVTDNKLVYKDAFYQTLFYKGYVGGDKPQGFPIGASLPGAGLEHFRAVKVTQTVKLLRYFPGAEVSGVVLDPNGMPRAGVTVVAVDDLDIEHGKATTDADGRYTVIAPFGTLNSQGVLQNTTIRVKEGSAVLAEEGLQISEAAAFRKVPYQFTQDFALKPGNLTGFVYLDRDHDGQYTPDVDSFASGVQVTIANGPSTTVDANGNFTLVGVSPGSRSISFSAAPGYHPATRTASVTSHETAGMEPVGLMLKKISVNGTITNPNEPGIPRYEVDFEALNPDTDYSENTTAVAEGDGVFHWSVFPGTYRATVNHTVTDNGTRTTYTGSYTFTVNVGNADVYITKSNFNIQTRTEPAP